MSLIESIGGDYTSSETWNKFKNKKMDRVEESNKHSFWRWLDLSIGEVQAAEEEK